MKTYAIIAGLAVITGALLLGAMNKATKSPNVITAHNTQLEEVLSWNN